MDTPPTEERSLADQAEAAPGDADRPTGSRPKGVFPPPRKLTDEQEREVTRLYAETATPLAEIAGTYGISQTSVSRVAQRHGAGLRSRGSPRAGDRRVSPTSGSRQQAAAAVSPEEPLPAGARGGRRRRREADSGEQARRRGAAATAAGRPRAEAAPAALPVAQASSGPARRRFRISFVAEQVIQAETIHEAIAQAEALGATDITSITREA